MSWLLFFFAPGNRHDHEYHLPTHGWTPASLQGWPSPGLYLNIFTNKVVVTSTGACCFDDTIRITIQGEECFAMALYRPGFARMNG